MLLQILSFVLLLSALSAGAQPSQAIGRALTLRFDPSRSKHTTPIPGKIIVRFRRGALDSARLEKSFRDGGAVAGTAAADGIASSRSPSRGWPLELCSRLFAERFQLSDSTNVIEDLALSEFLVTSGARYLRRLTTASPIDTLSITRTGDTIGCDHANWMLLIIDSSIDPAQFAHALAERWPNEVLLALPCYKGVRLLGSTPKTPADEFYGCEAGQRDMMNVGTAWHYEVGHDSILLAGYDAGCDWMHPDLGGGIGPGHHVAWAWEYASASEAGARLQPGHGTACFGIMGALTNNVLPLPEGSQSVAGIAGGWHNLPPDTINPNPAPNGGASLLIFADKTGSTDGFISLMFEAAAHSTTTPYGLGVHVMNIPAVFTWEADSTGTAIHAAIDYLFENGVVVAAARDDESPEGTTDPSYPACFEEPWVLNVSGSVPGKGKTPPCDYGNTIDLLAPSGSMDGCDSATHSPFGWTVNYTTKCDIPGKYYYGPFAGSSAAVSNAAACVALLRSHFLRLDPAHSQYLEPEDYSGILKASAWRRDPGRLSDAAKQNAWVDSSGWGHLDIGKVFQMLDPDTNAYPFSGYQVRHVSHPFDPATFELGAWTPKDSVKYYFNTPWSSADRSPQYQQRAYLIDTEGTPYYYVKLRTVTKRDTLPDIWSTSDTAPLFAWGRSGSVNEKSGWSDAEENFQTGWSRVVDGSGGDELNEGIFHNSRIVTTETMQYDVWGYVKGSGWVKPLGHYPPDSMLGVNYSLFGRPGRATDMVEEPRNVATGPDLRITLDAATSALQAHYYVDAPAGQMKLELYDALGREIVSAPIGFVTNGWNVATVPVSTLAAGVYIARILGTTYSQSKPFALVK